MHNIWIGLEEGDEVNLKIGVYVGELEGKGGEYKAEVVAALKVSRTEEGCSQETISKHAPSNGLSDRCQKFVRFYLFLSLRTLSSHEHSSS